MTEDIIAKKLLDTPCSRPALLWEELPGHKVQCNVCERRCIIPEGHRGFCGARYNYGGELYVITYGNISSMSNNPMAKKPFFNFRPNEYALTIGSWGCNFTCPWCQNYEISKTKAKSCYYLSPQKFIDKMRKYNSSGTSFSFNEPLVTLFEYSLDVIPLAKKNGFFNTYVTNGYMTPESLRLLVKNGLDAVNIDIKGCRGSIDRWVGADVEIVWRNAKLFKELGVHVEITTLIIPTVNDSPECLRSIARRIKQDLGPETPWHVTRYFAAYKALEKGLPTQTPTSMVENAYMIGKKEGLYYVYVGNVWPSHPWENTYCPYCGQILISRVGYSVELLIEEPFCPKCGEIIHIVFRDRRGLIKDWRKILGRHRA